VAGTVGTDGVKSFTLVRGSVVTLAQTYNNFSFKGTGATILLGGQDITSCTFERHIVTGIGTSVGGRVVLNECSIVDLTVNAASFVNSAIAGTITLAEAISYVISNCISASADLVPIIDFGALVGSQELNMPHYDGHVELQNMGQLGTDVALITGGGTLTLNANCVGGLVTISGDWTIINNGTTTVVRDEVTQDIIDLKIGVNVSKVNDTVIIGDGSSGADLFRSTLEP